MSVILSKYYIYNVCYFTQLICNIVVAPYPTRAGKRTSRAHAHICPYIAVDGYTAEFGIFRFPIYSSRS